MKDAEFNNIYVVLLFKFSLHNDKITFRSDSESVTIIIMTNPLRRTVKYLRCNSHPGMHYTATSLASIRVADSILALHQYCVGIYRPSCLANKSSLIFTLGSSYIPLSLVVLASFQTGLSHSTRRSYSGPHRFPGKQQNFLPQGLCII